MPRYTNLGETIGFDLSEFGYDGFYVICRFLPVRNMKDKYSLSMWIGNKDVDDTFKIDSYETDTQIIPGTRQTIKQNIARIVEQAAKTGYFTPFIESYEYTYRCFNRGNEMFETERTGG